MRVLVTGAAGFIGRALTRELLRDPRLAGADGRTEPISELVLADIAEPPPPGTLPDAKVTRCRIDLADESGLEPIWGEGFHSIFHLAASLTLEAERDPPAGWAVNLRAPLRLMEAARRTSPRRPRMVCASSMAVFGGDLPDRVDESTPPAPRTAYGTAKAATELLLADHTRRGDLDGRALRPPVVLLRRGAASPAVSDIIAAMAREPLEGRDFAAPFAPEDAFPVVSAAQVARSLRRLHDAPGEALPFSRAVNQPGLTVTAGEIAEALARVGGPEAAARLSFAPDPAIRQVVSGWPRALVSSVPLPEPLEADPDFDAILRGFLAGEG
ncbi:MAG: NAD-dependent epimerase/dehydratase family protein [Pseudomonadota bacterium]